MANPKIYVQLKGNLIGYYPSGSFALIAPADLSFDNAGTAVNVGINVIITSGDLISEITRDLAIATFASMYVNMTYGLSTTVLDVERLK